MKPVASIALVLVAACGHAPEVALLAETAAGTEALLLANVDDDDGDGLRDGLDDRVNGDADRLDLTRVTLRADCAQAAKLTLGFEPAATAEHVTLFDGPGAIECTPGQPVRLTLAVEAKRPRNARWDGRTRLVVRDGQGRVLAEQRFRVVPVLFPDVTRAARRLYGVAIADEAQAGNSEATAALTELAAGLPATLADGRAYNSERWMQDALQAGTQSIPAGTSEHVIETLLQTDRPTGKRGLEYFVSRDAIGRDIGFVAPGRSDESLLSFGGNIEVVPPFAGAPLGRLVVGGGGQRHAGSGTVAFLNAQEAQGPVLELDSAWLANGHLDELLAFLPDGAGWKVAFASPRLALERLRALQREGQGGRRLLNASGTTTVDEVLASAGLVAFNEAAQRRIDRVRAELLAATGVSPVAVVELPQLYRGDEAGLAVALHPSAVNLVVLGGSVAVAHTDAAGDVFEPVVERALAGLGLGVRFVDAQRAYHGLSGGLHCGFEVQRDPPRAWWSLSKL